MVDTVKCGVFQSLLKWSRSSVIQLLLKVTKSCRVVLETVVQNRYRTVGTCSCASTTDFDKGSSKPKIPNGNTLLSLKEIEPCKKAHVVPKEAPVSPSGLNALVHMLMLKCMRMDEPAPPSTLEPALLEPKPKPELSGYLLPCFWFLVPWFALESGLLPGCCTI